MKVLFLSNWFPYPPINGAKIRIWNLIRELASEHEVSLFAFARTFSMEEVRERTPVVRQFCRRVEVIPGEAFDPDGNGSKIDLLSRLPRSVVRTYSTEMESRVMKALVEEEYDVLVASEVGPPGVVSWLASKAKSIPVILDGIEIATIKDDYVKRKPSLRRMRSGLTWWKAKGFTARTLRRTAASTVPSNAELQLMREAAGDEPIIEMVPHGLDMESFAGPFNPPKPNSLVFTGSLTYEPNGDAIVYFLDRIYPRVKQIVPDVTLTVLGATGDVDLKRFQHDPSLSFPGLVQDVKPRVAASWLSIVPLRLGAGTRLKIVESMALGTPAVSTSKGAEGLAVMHGQNILIADDPEKLAAAVAAVVRDTALRERLSVSGKQLIAERYTATAMGQSVSRLMERVVAQRRGN